MSQALETVRVFLNLLLEGDPLVDITHHPFHGGRLATLSHDQTRGEFGPERSAVAPSKLEQVVFHNRLVALGEGGVEPGLLVRVVVDIPCGEAPLDLRLRRVAENLGPGGVNGGHGPVGGELEDAVWNRLEEGLVLVLRDSELLGPFLDHLF